MVVQTVKKHLHSVLGAIPESAFIAFLLKRAFPKSALAVRLSTAAVWPVELRESVWGVQCRASSVIRSCGAYWGSGSVFGALNLKRFRER